MRIRHGKDEKKTLDCIGLLRLRLGLFVHTRHPLPEFYWSHAGVLAEKA